MIKGATESQNKNLTTRTFKGFLWLFSGTSVYSVLRVTIVIILARLLTPDDFGKVTAAMVVVGFVQIFSQIGIGPSIVQIPDLKQEHVSTGFLLSLLTGLVVGGMIVLFAPFVAWFYKMPDLVPIVRVLAIGFPLRSMAVVAESLLLRDLQFRKLAMADVVSFGAGYGIVSVILAMMNFGVWALIVATLTQTLFVTVILLGMQSHSRSLHFNIEAAKELLFLGGGFTSLRFLNYFALQGDYLVVGRWLGASALGLYTRAYTLMTVPVTLFGEILSKTLFVSMSSIQNETERLSRAYLRGIAIVSLVMFPVSGITYVLAPEIVLTLLGPTWSEAIYPFQVLALGMYFRVGYKVSGTLTQAVGAVYGNARRQGVYAVLVIIGAWIGQHWGVSMVAVGIVMALSVHFLLSSQLAIGLLSLTWRQFFKAQARGLGLAGILGISAWSITWVLRSLNTPAITTIMGTLLILGFLFVLMALIFPRFILGQDGLWFLETLFLNLLPEKSSYIANILRNNWLCRFYKKSSGFLR